MWSAQEQMLVLHAFDPHSPLYNVPWCVRLVGALDVRALRRALEWVVERHEVLRTHFVVDSSGGVQTTMYQVVEDMAAHTVALKVEDVRGAEDARAAAMELVEAEVGRGFDLYRGPVMRSLLVQVEEGEHMLLVNTHHVATDEWS